MSNFEKRNLRSGHLMCPGGVTFGVIGSSFFLEMCQIVGWAAMEIWRRYAPPFFRYLRKTWGGRITAPPPPAVRGLNLIWASGVRHQQNPEVRSSVLIPDQNLGGGADRKFSEKNLLGFSENNSRTSRPIVTKLCIPIFGQCYHFPEKLKAVR